MKVCCICICILRESDSWQLQETNSHGVHDCNLAFTLEAAKEVLPQKRCMQPSVVNDLKWKTEDIKTLPRLDLSDNIPLLGKIKTNPQTLHDLPLLSDCPPNQTSIQTSTDATTDQPT